MTATATEAPATTELLELKLTDVAVHPSNLRHELRDLDDLAASIKEHGVLEPPIVAPWPDSLNATAAQRKKYLLIAGHRRHAASKIAGVKTVVCILRPDLDTETAQLAAMLAENLHRNDLSPVEEAEGYQAMLAFPEFTQARVAKETGQPASRVRERLKIVKLVDTVKTRLHSGQISIADALAVGEFDDDAKTTKALLAKAGTEGFGFALQSAREERKRSAEKARKVDALAAAGVTVVSVKPNGWKAVRTIFERAPQVDEDALHTWFLKHHAQCPGAIVVDGKLNEWERPQLHYGCGEPSRHPGPKPPKKSQTELDAEKKAVDEQAAREVAVAAANTLRRDFLKEAVQTATVPLAKVVLVDAILDYWQHEGDVALARIADFAGKPAAATSRDELSAALMTLALPALAVIFDLERNKSQENYISSSNGSLVLRRADEDPDARWIQKLDTVYGYEWTTFERERFRAALDPQPEPDEPEEYGVTGPEVDLEPVDDDGDIPGKDFPEDDTPDDGVVDDGADEQLS